MTVTINGTTGIAGVDGSAATPAGQGVDTNTGVFYGTDIVGISTGGTERMRVNASGHVGIGTTANYRLAVVGGAIQLSGSTEAAAGLRVQTASGVATLTGINSDNNAFNPVAFYTSATEAMRIAANGDLSFNSGYGSAAVAYGCRAWVNFNGTGTVAIRGSGNVTSITDNGTGDYTVNFTTAIVDANYSAVYTVSLSSGAGFGETTNSGLATTTARFRSNNTGGTLVDATIACASFFR